MSELVALIEREIDTVVRQAGATYGADSQRLVHNLQGSAKSRFNRQAQKIVSKIPELTRLHSHYNANPDIGFNRNTFEILIKESSILENHLPDSEETSSLLEDLVSSVDQSRLSRANDLFRKFLVAQGSLAAATAAGSLYFENWYATTAFGIASSLGFFSAKNKDSIFPPILAGLAHIIGTGLLTVFTEHTPNSPEQYVLGGVVLANFITATGVNRVSPFMREHRLVREQLKAVDLLGIKHDQFLLYATAVHEASRNLRYAHNVCQSEGRSLAEFQPQIDRLERTLMAYVHGKATYEDVLAAQITYREPGEQPQRILLPVRPTAPPRKAGYTPEEYSQVKESEKPEVRKRKRGSAVPLDIVEINLDCNQPQPRVMMSGKLQAHYADSNYRIANYDGRAVIDLAQSKAVACEQHRIIRETTGAGDFIRRTVLEHGLPPDATLFNLQPRGSLRAIYTIRDNTITVLDVMTHSEYDRRLRQR